MQRPREHVIITDHRQRTLVLAGVAFALLAVVASVSGLNVAQAAIAGDLGASQSQLLWIINGYTVALAAFLLPLGAIGDRIGRKPVLLVGLGLFVLSGLASAFATSAGMLVGLRVVAGIAAAMIMPATLSTITATFPPAARGSAIGVWAGVAAAGGILGLVSSAALVDHVTWPWVFAMPVVASVVAAVLIAAFTPNTGDAHPARFDTAGAALSALAVGGVVLGIHEGPERGWADPLTMIGLAVGVLALAGFVVAERRADHPLLDLRAFRSKLLSAGSLTLTAMFAVLAGIMLVLIQFLMVVLGYSALKASASMLPMAVPLILLSPFTPVLARRVGTRAMLTGGLLVGASGLGAMAVAADNGSYLAVLPGLLLLATGLSLSMTTATTGITGALPESQQGVASALNDTVREVGAALGVALLGSVMNAGYRSAISDTADALPPEAGDAVREGVLTAVQVAGSMGADGATLYTQATDAFVDGWITAMWVGAAVLTAAAVTVLTFLRRAGAEPAMPAVERAAAVSPGGAVGVEATMSR